jgi:hypothetical protein
MKISPDARQRLMATASCLIELYKVTMGTFLVLFVPQDCDGTVCGVMDNLTESGVIHRVALGANSVTFLGLLFLYGVEIFREDWCITYLDIDPNKPNNNLDTEIESYPEIKMAMERYNHTYMDSFYFACGLVMLNFCMSMTSIVSNSVGLQTYLAALSFLVLLSGKMYSTYTVGTMSIEDERAFSAYLTIHRTYNTIDADHKNLDQPIGPSEIELSDSSD